MNTGSNGLIFSNQYFDILQLLVQLKNIVDLKLSTRLKKFKTD